MKSDQKLKTLEQKILSVAAKSKRLDDALSQLKIIPERGNVYIFNLDNTPEDMAVFWVILNTDPSDPKRFFAVPADTDTLIGSFDMPVPESSLFGPLVLRLRRGLWLQESLLEPSSRVGIIESLFIDRAQFIMSRIAKGDWISSEKQQATDTNPDYEEWMEMLDRFYVALKKKREKEAVAVNIYKQIIEGVRYLSDKVDEFFIDISGKGMRKIEDAFVPAYAYATRNAAAVQTLSEEDTIGIVELKKIAPILPVKFLRLQNNIKINFQWLELMIQTAPAVSMTLRGKKINADDISWQDKGNIQVLKVSNCIVLATEQEQAKSLLQIRFKDNVLNIDILPPMHNA